MQLQGLLPGDGRPSHREPGRDQARLPQAGAQVPPGRQQGKGRRGEVQGAAGGERGPQGPGEARRLRPARRRLAAGPGLPSAARLGQGLRALARPGRRRRRASSATSSPSCSASAARSAVPRTRAAARAAAATFSAPGQDHVARVEIDLEDAFRGGTRTIELRSPEMTADGHVMVKPRTLRVSIPAGVTEGQQIRLAGQGSPGVGGGPHGDLFLEVTIRQHPLFKLEGRDVTLTLPVAPWEAALGETVAVPTLGGSVDMKLPAAARAGQKLRLRGRGLPGQSARRPVRAAQDRAAARQPGRAAVVRADEARGAVRPARGPSPVRRPT